MEWLKIKMRQEGRAITFIWKSLTFILSTLEGFGPGSGRARLVRGLTFSGGLEFLNFSGRAEGPGSVPSLGHIPECIFESWQTEPHNSYTNQNKFLDPILPIPNYIPDSVYN